MYAPLFVAGYVAWVWFCALFTSANPSPFVGVIVVVLALKAWNWRYRVMRPRGYACSTCSRVNPVRGGRLCTKCRRVVSRSPRAAVY